MLEAGEILQDRYRIEKQIGQGGMGSVYLATDERFNNTVAIKETLFTEENYVKAFQREARLLNSLKHTALPKVSDHFCIEGDGQYIVMEYIGGDDLFEMMEQSGEAFPIKDVLIWAEQLLDALEYLHGQENPIIHRDIKPQNLKLTPQGQVILLDFGLAKGNPTDANHQTAANSIFGYSRNYASLEQIQGTGTDPRSDVYSLAATVYHLATGKPPADALTRVMMVLNEERDPLISPHMIHEQVPEDLSACLEDAMSLNANLRPQSVEEMRNLLSNKKRTIVSTKPNTVPNDAAGTNLRTQNTKIFDEGERAVSDSKQSDIKTEILPVSPVVGDSVRTKVVKNITLSDKQSETQNSPIVAETNPKRGGVLAAAGLGLLFLVGTVASMAYFLSPTDSASDSKQGTAAVSPVLSDSNTALPEDLDANANLDGDDSTLAESNKEPEITLEDVPEKVGSVKSKTETALVPKTPKTKATPSERNSKSSVVAKDKSIETGDVTIRDGEVITKDAIIKNGKVETKDVIISDGKIKIKKPPKLPNRLPLTREEFRKLTPKQKEKIRAAMKEKRRLEIRRKLELERLKRRRKPPPRPRPRP